jgi:hypothetical protein
MAPERFMIRELRKKTANSGRSGSFHGPAARYRYCLSEIHILKITMHQYLLPNNRNQRDLYSKSATQQSFKKSNKREYTTNTLNKI